MSDAWIRRRSELMWKEGLTPGERHELEALHAKLKEHMRANPSWQPGNVGLTVKLGELVKKK